MKLPSINKPTSAQSTRKAQSIQNLENNLMAKFSEYDQTYRIDDIQKVKKQGQTENVVKRMQIKEEYIPIEPIKITPKVDVSATLKPILKNKPKAAEQIENNNMFLTGQAQIEPKYQKQERQVSSDSEHGSEDSDGSVDRMISHVKDLQKQRKQIGTYGKGEFGEVNKMIYDTQNDMVDHLKGVVNLNQQIQILNTSIKQSGFGIDQQLLVDLEQSYKNMIQLQRESEAIEEYNLQEMMTHKSKKMPALRSGSVANQKKKPTTKKQQQSKDCDSDSY